MSDAIALAGDNPSFSADLDSIDFNAPAEDVGDAGTELEAAADEPLEDNEPLAAEEALPDTEEVLEPEPTEPAKPKEELPEGVRLVERDGKKEYRLNESRYGVMQDGLHLRRELEERYAPELETSDGKPPTVEALRTALDLRERAYQGMREMDLDFMSGDPASQGKVIDHWLKNSAEALRSGDVATDPIVAFAGNFFDTLAQRHPDAYAQISARASMQMVEDLYQAAIDQGDKNLFISAQRVEAKLFNRYRNEDGSTVNVQPLNSAPAPNFSTRQAQPRQQQAPANGVKQQWENFRVGADRDSKAAYREQTVSALADVKKAYDKAGFPQTYEAVLESLNSRLHKELNDPASQFARDIANQLRAAQMTPSEQKRQEIKAKVVKAYQSRAKLIIGKILPAIQAEAVKATKVRLDATHQRREAAQNRRAPGGGGPTPARSLIPDRSSEWNPNNFGKEMDRILG